MNSAQEINIREIAVPAISTMVLFSAAILLPPFGILLSVFCPIPIILAYLYRGQKFGLTSLLAVAGVLFLFANVQQSMIFFVEYGLVAVVMAESIRRNYSVGKVVLYSVGASLLLGGALIYLLIHIKEVNLGSIMAKQIEQSMAASLNLYREMGTSSDELNTIKYYSEKLTSFFIRSIPAWMIVSSSISVLLNYMLVKKIWNKYGNMTCSFTSKGLDGWSADENFVWLLISSGIMLFIPMESANTIGLNLLLVSFLIYFYQGIAIVLFYMRKKTFPFFLKVFVYMLIIIQPLLLLFVIFLGLFDMWADFRKLKSNVDIYN